MNSQQLFFEVFHNGAQIPAFTSPNDPVGVVSWKLASGDSVSLSANPDQKSATATAVKVGVSTVAASVVGAVSTVNGVTGLFQWDGTATLTVTEAAATPVTSAHIGTDAPLPAAPDFNISVAFTEAVPTGTA
jgi:hypothetical protein